MLVFLFLNNPNHVSFWVILFTNIMQHFGLICASINPRKRRKRIASDTSLEDEEEWKKVGCFSMCSPYTSKT